MLKNILSGNIIKINNTFKTIENVTCKELYWHLINTDPPTPMALQQWYFRYPTSNEVSVNIWSQIFKLSFKTVRDTKIHIFQYRIIQKINKSLYTQNLK